MIIGEQFAIELEQLPSRFVDSDKLVIKTVNSVAKASGLLVVKTALLLRYS